MRGIKPHYLLAKIKGIGYNEIPKETISKIRKLEEFRFEKIGEKNEGYKYFEFNTLNTQIRIQLPNCFITTYTHLPLIGVNSITDPNLGMNIFYYDKGKLSSVRDRYQNILQNYKYHYKHEEINDIESLIENLNE